MQVFIFQIISKHMYLLNRQLAWLNFFLNTELTLES